MTYDDLEPLRDEPGGAAWLDALPTLVDECVERWSLIIGEPFGHGYSSLAMPATLPDGTDSVLKVELPHREAEHEAMAFGPGTATARFACWMTIRRDARSCWNGRGPDRT